ncbi:MAG: sigma-54-dependent Fis family transcriptional regulator [Candidatus Rokubacteria bacterium]|nr:sigma-54-dependent Fis family transcriptional regulator [Candidatus Rokubacteria bacterium]
MESHMFGHVRGAFTGAVQNQPGVLSTANTGSLFIDEIGELSLPLQAKLLRAIQFREFTMVGGNQRQRTDIRLITATNRDLRRAVAEGQFRADLYYRIAVVQIVVPPLRQRREDIPLLAQYFIEKFSAAYRRPIRRPTAAALDALVSFDWPGNVRQLENCLEQAIIFAQGDILDIEDLRFASDRRADVRDAAAPTTIGSFTGRSLRDLETWYIQQTLQRLGGNRTKTAEYLGLSLRGLQYKLKRYAAAETTWVGNLA